jgi:hypothetical protein
VTTANAIIARERLDYFTDMLRASGWSEDYGHWLAPLHLREQLGKVVGRGHVALWIAVAAQIQLDSAIVMLGGEAW